VGVPTLVSGQATAASAGNVAHDRAADQSRQASDDAAHDRPGGAEQSAQEGSTDRSQRRPDCATQQATQKGPTDDGARLSGRRTSGLLTSSDGQLGPSCLSFRFARRTIESEAEIRFGPVPSHRVRLLRHMGQFVREERTPRRLLRPVGVRPEDDRPPEGHRLRS